LCWAVLVVGCSDDGEPLLDASADASLDAGVDLARDSARSDAAPVDQALMDAAAPDMASPDMSAPDLAAADLKAPDQKVPDMLSPDQLVPDQLVLDQLVPDQLVPDQLVPDQAVPDMMVPDQMAPDMSSPAPDAGGSGYAAAVLADNPEAYYRLNETGNPALLKDATGNGWNIGASGAHTGEIINKPSFNVAGLVPGDATTAMELAAPVNQHVHRALGPGLRPTGAASIELLFRFPGAVPKSSHHVMAAIVPQGAHKNGRGIGVHYHTSTGKVHMRKGYGVTWETIDSGTMTFKADQTYHVVATVSAAGSMRLYIDGLLVGSKASTLKPVWKDGCCYPSPGQLFIGADKVDSGTAPAGNKQSAGNKGFFTGIIDEVAIYDKALTAAQVAAHHKQL